MLLLVEKVTREVEYITLFIDMQMLTTNTWKL